MGKARTIPKTCITSSSVSFPPTDRTHPSVYDIYYLRTSYPRNRDYPHILPRIAPCKSSKHPNTSLTFCLLLLKFASSSDISPMAQTISLDRTQTQIGLALNTPGTHSKTTPDPHP